MRVGLLVVLLLSGCGVGHIQPYAPGVAAAPVAADAVSSSDNCFEASTPVEQLACSDAGLGRAKLRLTEVFQADLARADLFGRDVLMASQRAWLLSLPGACPLASATAVTCLDGQFEAQTALLSAWRPSAGRGVGAVAMSEYVHLRPVPGSLPDGGFCAGFAAAANGALTGDGTVDPGEMAGAVEIAGSHGGTTGSVGGRVYAVLEHQANAYGGFYTRASAVRVDGVTVLDSVALGNALEKSAANAGGRFSAYASQTGDYGAADVFAYRGRILALLTDPVGFTSPAAPGEFAHAGLWVLGPAPAPVCLFENFQMPPDVGPFDGLPNFAAWRAALGEITENVPPALGVAFLRDSSQLRAETNWLLLNMPLVVTSRARDSGWVLWLRLRHDAVLDALYGWGQADPSHKAVFDKVMALLRPAAAELVQTYQRTQALTAAEAQNAAGITVMEMLYGATVTVAPGLGADLAAPGDAAGKPRYKILATPG